MGNACDNCRYIRNSDQADYDGDNIGDACDNCQTVANAGQEDGNSEAEKVAQPSQFPTDWQPPTGERSQDWLTINYPGDACDSTPLTEADPTELAYTPAGNPRVLAGGCTLHPGTGCGGSNVPHGCDNLSRNNGIIENGVQGEAAANKQKELGWSRTMRCACSSSQSPAQCYASGCVHSSASAGFGASWQTMTIDDRATSSAITNSSAEFPTEYWSVRASNGGQAFTRTLGWRYWADMSGLPSTTWHPDPNAPSDTTKSQPQTIFDGLMWSWVKNFDVTTRPSVATIFGTTAQQNLRQSVSPQRIAVREQGSPDQNGPSCVIGYKPKIWPFEGECPMCRTSYLGIDVSDPSPWSSATFHLAGMGSKPASSIISQDVASDIVSSSYEVALAGDVVGSWGGTVAGATVNVATHAVLRKIVRSAQGTYSLTNGSSTTGTGALVMAVSGRRQELTFFADTTGGGANYVRIYDFDLNATRTAQLLGPVALVAPQAATYRGEDDSYYVLDAATYAGTTTPSMRLVRISRGQTTEIVWEWDRNGNSTRTRLSTGTDGSVVVSCDGRRTFTIGELWFDEFRSGSRTTYLRQIWTGSGDLAAPALRNLAGLFYWVDGAARSTAVPLGGAATKVDRLASCF
ncbi:hypothetical protein BH09MYX1_BH09MYX1_56800 [soil metagenome]